jgi:pimeloyl-ACP methyl ester carboxylesterase
MRIGEYGAMRSDRHDGLAYTLVEPDGEPLGGVVVLHGAGSCKENHLHFARARAAQRLAAIAFDQRGHGASEGALGAGAIDDVGAIAARPAATRACRGAGCRGHGGLGHQRARSAGCAC